MGAPIFNYVLAPSMETHRDEFPGLGELGRKRSVFGKIMKVVKAPLKLQRKIEKKIWKKTMPKAVRKVFSRKNFIKFAPILAIVAQVLNIIPGLGVAVSIAILAGASALGVAAAIAKKNEAAAANLKAKKNADAQANASFDQSKDYLEPKYGVTQAQFHAMSFENKQAFLQQASDEAPSASGMGGSFSRTRFYAVSGLGATPSAPAADSKAQLDAQQHASDLADAAFDKSQGYFTQKYNVSDATFKAMTLEGKLNFLQVAAEDADQESKAGQGIFEVVSTPPAPSGAAAAPASQSKKPEPPGIGLGTVAVVALFAMAIFSRKSR